MPIARAGHTSGTGKAAEKLFSLNKVNVGGKRHGGFVPQSDGLCDKGGMYAF